MSESSLEHTPMHSRRSLLGKAALTAVAAGPVIGLLNSTAEASPYPGESLSTSAKESFRDIFTHEQAHVARLTSTLGKAARPRPTFKNLNTADFPAFVRLSRMISQVAVGAYLGGLPNLASHANRGLAGEFALIEARHAGFLEVFAGYDITTQAKTMAESPVDLPLTIAEIQNMSNPFIVSLNGGPAFTFTKGDDTSIFNFALVLEYLELTFLEMNTPKYVGTN